MLPGNCQYWFKQTHKDSLQVWMLSTSTPFHVTTRLFQFTDVAYIMYFFKFIFRERGRERATLMSEKHRSVGLAGNPGMSLGIEPPTFQFVG